MADAPKVDILTDCDDILVHTDDPARAIDCAAAVLREMGQDVSAPLVTAGPRLWRYVPQSNDPDFGVHLTEATGPGRGAFVAVLVSFSPPIAEEPRRG